MNGRIYDPTLGRFLQADPHIQAPTNSQNYNRYSYVLNNPLSYTDPSGYFFKKLFKGLNKMLGKFAPLVSIGLSILAPWGTSFWASVGTGFIAGGIATGSLKGALTGAFTAGMFHGIGTHFQGMADSAGVLSTGARIGKTLAHGVAGGISNVLNGGKFGHGFVSAGFTQAFSGVIDKIGGRIGNITLGSYFSTANRAMRIVASAVVGGTASALTGGKFANGAVTGAFSRGVNDEAHFQAEQESWSNKFWRSMPSLPQGLVDFSAGFGDVLSFGGTDLIRDYMGTNGAVNADSSDYTAGEISGVVHSTALGGALGLRVAGSAGRGVEFSHWIPNGMGGPRSLWNGNFVTREFHALSDPFRYRFMPRAWKAFNPMPSAVTQQWHRVPYVYKGGAAGLGYGTASASSN